MSPEGIRTHAGELREDPRTLRESCCCVVERWTGNEPDGNPVNEHITTGVPLLLMLRYGPSH